MSNLIVLSCIAYLRATAKCFTPTVLHAHVLPGWRCGVADWLLIAQVLERNWWDRRAGSSKSHAPASRASGPQRQWGHATSDKRNDTGRGAATRCVRSRAPSGLRLAAGCVGARESKAAVGPHRRAQRARGTTLRGICLYRPACAAASGNTRVVRAPSPEACLSLGTIKHMSVHMNND